MVTLARVETFILSYRLSRRYFNYHLSRRACLNGNAPYSRHSRNQIYFSNIFPFFTLITCGC